MANSYSEKKGRIYWADLYRNEYFSEVGDLTNLEPNLQFSVTLQDNSYEFSLGGGSHAEAPPIICTSYLNIGNPMPWQQSYKALAGYRITEIQID